MLVAFLRKLATVAFYAILFIMCLGILFDPPQKRCNKPVSDEKLQAQLVAFLDGFWDNGIHQYNAAPTDVTQADGTVLKVKLELSDDRTNLCDSKDGGLEWVTYRSDLTTDTCVPVY